MAARLIWGFSDRCNKCGYNRMWHTLRGRWRLFLRRYFNAHPFPYSGIKVFCKFKSWPVWKLDNG